VHHHTRLTVYFMQSEVDGLRNTCIVLNVSYHRQGSGGDNFAKVGSCCPMGDTTK
jgi:hypothetical protein